MKINELGRSMVEMLGVLAVIGVLSIGGIAGYTLAMDRYRANEIADAVSKLVVVAQSANGGQGLSNATGMVKKVDLADLGGYQAAGVPLVLSSNQAIEIGFTFPTIPILVGTIRFGEKNDRVVRYVRELLEIPEAKWSFDEELKTVMFYADILME